MLLQLIGMLCKDALALRLANALVGNKEGDAAIEITFSGPTVRA